MALRFRKSMKVAPGIRLNFSKSGVSTSLGPKGSKITIGKNGIYSNVGVPGTGIYMRDKISKNTNLKSNSSSNMHKLKGNNALFENDISDLESYEGKDPYLEAELINSCVDNIINVAHKTPHIGNPISFPVEVFIADKPKFEPSQKTVVYPVLWVVATIFLGVQLSLGVLLTLITSALAAGFSHHKIVKKEQKGFDSTILAQWEKEKLLFENDQAEKRHAFNCVVQKATENPTEALEAVFNIIEWPRETNISFEVEQDVALLDVDLPEIEDMPKTRCIVRGRGYKKNLIDEEISEAQRRKDYSKHIHGIGMLLCGSVFNTLPQINTVIISGYSQRISSTTGQVNDEYLYSVKVDRSKWKEINFKNIKHLDPIEALGSFEIRRKMTKTGIFRPIEPY